MPTIREFLCSHPEFYNDTEYDLVFHKGDKQYKVLTNAFIDFLDEQCVAAYETKNLFNDHKSVIFVSKEQSDV